MIQIRKSPRNVVIVDGNRSDYVALTKSVRQGGVIPQFVASGQEALRLARANHGEVWLIGVELPDMSGFDLCEMLHQRLANIRVCMIAGEYHGEHEAASYRCGATFYACKSLGTSWLAECTRQLLEATSKRCHTVPITGHHEGRDTYLAGVESENPWRKQ
jgi:DNA-binding response OmpR family regulator